MYIAWYINPFASFSFITILSVKDQYLFWKLLYVYIWIHLWWRIIGFSYLHLYFVLICWFTNRAVSVFYACDANAIFGPGMATVCSPYCCKSVRRRVFLRLRDVQIAFLRLLSTLYGVQRVSGKGDG